MTHSSRYPNCAPPCMLVAKLPGSTYATLAMKAGPRKGSSCGSQLFLLWPDKTREAASRVPRSFWRGRSSTEEGSTPKAPGASGRDHENLVGHAPAERVIVLADHHVNGPVKGRSLGHRDYRLRHDAQLSQVAQQRRIIVAHAGDPDPLARLGFRKRQAAGRRHRAVLGW